MGTSIKHAVPDRVKPSFVIFDFQHSGAQSWLPKVHLIEMVIFDSLHAARGCLAGCLKTVYLYALISVYLYGGFRTSTAVKVCVVCLCPVQVVAPATRCRLNVSVRSIIITATTSGIILLLLIIIIILAA